MACSKKTPISFMCQQYRNSIFPRGKGVGSSCGVSLLCHCCALVTGQGWAGPSHPAGAKEGAQAGAQRSHPPIPSVLARSQRSLEQLLAVICPPSRSSGAERGDLSPRDSPGQVKWGRGATSSVLSPKPSPLCSDPARGCQGSPRVFPCPARHPPPRALPPCPFSLFLWGISEPLMGIRCPFFGEFQSLSWASGAHSVFGEFQSLPSAFAPPGARGWPSPAPAVGGS